MASVFVVTDEDGMVKHVASTRKKAVKRAYALLEREEDDELESIVASERDCVEDAGHLASVEIGEYVVDDENV